MEYLQFVLRRNLHGIAMILKFPFGYAKKLTNLQKLLWKTDQNAYLLKKPIAAGPYGRKGLLLLVGGMKKEIGIQCAEATANAFFRTVSIPEHKTLSYLGVDAKGAIKKYPTALKEAYEAGKELVKG